MFMHVVLEISGKRQRSRLWAPKGLRAVWKLLTDEDQDSSQTIGEDARPEDVTQEVSQRHFSKSGVGLLAVSCVMSFPVGRDPDSRPPTNTFQKVMNSLCVVYMWATHLSAGKRPRKWKSLWHRSFCSCFPPSNSFRTSLCTNAVPTRCFTRRRE